MNIQIDKKLVHRSDLETAILLSFQWKSLNYTAVNFFSNKLSTLTAGKIHHLYKNRIYIVNKFEKIKIN